MTSRIRNEWYQTDNEIVVSVFIKNVDPATLSVEYTPASVSLSIKSSETAEIEFTLDPLAHAIDAELSSYNVGKVKVELKLKKKDMGVKWIKLEREAGEVEEGGLMQPTTASKPSYPSSSLKKTNWDAYVASETALDSAPPSADAPKDPNASGDSDVNKLFQTLYSGATDEQRRAMVKSYQESNGTSLSTDWDTVSKGKVETLPPDSMVARKWDGKDDTKASGNNTL